MANTQTPAAAGSGGTRSPITDVRVRSSSGVESSREARSRGRRSRQPRDEPNVDVVPVSAPSSSDSVISRLADFLTALLRDLGDSVSSLLS